MNIGITLLQQTTIMFILMMIGTLIYRNHIINEAGSQAFGNLLIKLVVPCLILNTLQTEFSTSKQIIILQSFIISLCLMSICIIVSHILYRKHPIIDFAITYSNAAFIGIPLINATLGSENVLYITGYIVTLIVMQFTIGMVQLTKDTSHISIKSLINNPVLLSFIIGFILFNLKITLPPIILSPISMLASINTPLAMIVCGILLAKTKILKLFVQPKLYLASLIRLIIIPIISLLFLKMINIDLNFKLALLISLSGPCGVNASIFAQKYNFDQEMTVQLICLSTILCCLTIPFIITLANFIF